MRRQTSLTVIAFATAMFGGGLTVRAQVVIDRALLRVSGAIETVITQLDVREARLLRLVDVQEATDEAIADQLVSRRLMLAELARVPTPEPTQEAFDAHRTEWRQSLGPNADVAALQASVGMSDAARAAWLRDDLRLRALIDRQFRAEAQPMRSELQRYYAAHPDEFTQGGILAPFEQVEAKVREKIASSNRALAVNRWLDSLRRRVDITPIR
jgi:hypothetical protein